MADYKVPFTFIAGTRARASQVNANFDYLAALSKTLDDAKAPRTGDVNSNFSVAEPTALSHAVTKRYVDSVVATGGGGGSGTGKTIFEVFHTLSAKTPPGAFSLRKGELIEDAKNTYFAFWEAIRAQGMGIIPTDFAVKDEGTEGEGEDTGEYTTSYENIEIYEGGSIDDPIFMQRAFSPYSWVTAKGKPTSDKPMVLQIELPRTTTCEFFKINSHVYRTYDSFGDPDPEKAIKTAAISIRQADGTWIPVAIINEAHQPDSNERYFVNTKPDLEFNAIRIVVSDNFGAANTDLSLYPVNAESNAIRIVTEEQWQWEVERYGQTGAFVLNETEETIRLPKVVGFLSGVSELWQIGTSHVNESGGSAVSYAGETQSLVFTNGAAGKTTNAVSTGLWIQAFNAVAEDALANIKYVPHATLFEERPFRFIPAEETGWFVSDGGWRDGDYFEDAMTELQNAYAKAVQPAGVNYKLAPDGKKFVTNEVYESTFKTYGEVPYYVLDNEGYRFKTPRSTNYIRYTDTVDNVGQLQLDGVPNLTGWIYVDDHGPQAGGMVQYQAGGGHGLENAGSGNGTLTIDASRCSEVYGRSPNEVRVKSSLYVMCVFLGNEVPQDSRIDVIKRVKAVEEQVSSFAEQIAKDKKEVLAQVATLNAKVQDQANAIASLESSAESNTLSINEHIDQIAALQTDVQSLQDSIQLLADRITALGG